MIMNIFLIPIISYCRKSVVIKIYTDIIDFIIKTVNDNLLVNDCGKVLYFIICYYYYYYLIHYITLLFRHGIY